MTNTNEAIILKSDTTKEEIRLLFLKAKPGLSHNSLRSYTSTIFNLNIDQKTKERTNELNLNNTQEVIDFVKNKQTKSAKTIFSTLNVLTGLQPYKIEMDNENVKMNALQTQQIKTQTQAENWINYSDIENIYDEISTDMWNLLIKYVKNKVPEKDKKRKFTILKQFLGFLVSSGYYVPPRRNEDFIYMFWDKPENDSEIFNYIDWEKKQFVYNAYKTSSVYNTQYVDIPSSLYKWLKTYKKIKKNDLVFPSDIYHKEMNTQSFAHMFHNFFKELPTTNIAHGKKISTRVFRQAYLSNLYKDVPKLTDMEKTANAMGHSVPVALKYYVKHSEIPPEMINQAYNLKDDDSEETIII